MNGIELDALKGQLKTASGLLYSTLIRIEGLKERLAEKDAAAADAERSRREQVDDLRKELRKARQLTSVKVASLDARGKIMQQLRKENKVLLADIAVAAEERTRLADLIGSIDVNANKPELVELIKTLKTMIGGNSASADEKSSAPTFRIADEKSHSHDDIGGSIQG